MRLYSLSVLYKGEPKVHLLKAAYDVSTFNFFQRSRWVSGGPEPPSGVVGGNLPRALRGWHVAQAEPCREGVEAFFFRGRFFLSLLLILLLCPLRMRW